MLLLVQTLLGLIEMLIQYFYCFFHIYDGNITLTHISLTIELHGSLKWKNHVNIPTSLSNALQWKVNTPAAQTYGKAFNKQLRNRFSYINKLTFRSFSFNTSGQSSNDIEVVNIVYFILIESILCEPQMPQGYCTSII